MRRALPWLAVPAALIAGALIPLGAHTRTDGKSLFEEVRSRIETGAVDTLSSDEIWIRAARGLVDRLDDPYADLYSPEQIASFSRNTLRNDYAGVGMSIQDQSGTVVVTATFSGSPARSGGVQPGDRIMSVDGVSTRGLRLDEVSDKLIGPAGTTVKVVFSRPGVSAPITMQFTRARIHVPAVPYAMLLDGKVGYIPLQRFSDSAGAEVGGSIADLRRQGARGFVLDLRGNPGGSLLQAIAVSERFLTPGQQVVSVRYRDREPDVGTAGTVAGDAALRHGEPVVVLTDGGTASAAEIVAGALQDHDRALVMGTTSYGKGVVQSLYPLRDGWALKLTTARWYTPSGRSIQRDREMVNGRYVLVTPDSTETDSVRKTRPAYKSDAGRAVYGGGGITPDLVIPSDTISTPEQHFLQAIAPASQKSYQALYDLAVALRPGLKPNFTVTTAWRDSLFRRMTGAGVPVTRAQFDSAGPLVNRLIEQQVATIAFGDSAAFRRRISGDSQLEKALDLLASARDQSQLFAVAGN